jgi:hypothetical protein
MSRLYRVCVLTLLALGAWLTAAPSVGAAAVGAAIGAGPLTISPTTVQLSYTIPKNGRKHIVTSSFAVTITDATGTAAGWEVRAASVATFGPLGAVPDVDHAIIDFDTTYANGTPPNPTCICDTIPTSLGEILRTPPETGTGRSTEVFITQLTVPTDAAPGTYNATLALDVVSLGKVLPLPGGRPTGPTIGGPAPKPLPSTRPVQDGPTVSGTPATLPTSLRPITAPTPSAKTPAQQPSADTNETSGGTQTTAALTAPVTSGSDVTVPTTAPTSSSRVVDETVAPRTTSGVQPSGTGTVSMTASIVNDTAPAQPSVAPSGDGGATPIANRVVTSNATENVAPAAASAYPVATMTGNAISFAPAPTVSGDDGTAGASANWRLQATYTSAGRSAISRVFGRNAPRRMNIGAVAIVVTETGLGQATMTFAPPQTDSERAVTGPAVVTISIVAGP